DRHGARNCHQHPAAGQSGADRAVGPAGGLLQARRGGGRPGGGGRRQDPVGRHGRCVRAQPHLRPRRHQGVPPARHRAVRGPPDGGQPRPDDAPVPRRRLRAAHRPRRNHAPPAQDALHHPRGRWQVGCGPQPPHLARRGPPRPRPGRHGARHDREPRLRWPEVHRHHGAEDPRGGKDDRRERLPDRPRGRWRHLLRHDRRRGSGRRPGPRRRQRPVQAPGRPHRRGDGAATAGRRGHGGV
ncbi:MAG: Ribulose-phosphate 3-epimerase, partial [uncultured Acidimicrobiales bacterium]